MSFDRAEDVLEVLRQMSLLTEADLAQAQRLAAPTLDARAFLELLQQRGLLTAFQKERLLGGKSGQLVLGPMILLDLLGEGAMGRVYLARKRGTTRRLALKVIHPSRVAPQAMQRFVREVLIAARLKHPNVVRTLELSSEVGTHYYAMEYLDGIDLARLVDEQGPLPIPQACAFALQTTSALHYIQSHGLVHRDIKPHNLMAISSTGVGGKLDTVKLLDLGLAILRPPENEGKTILRLTRLGTPMGTPDFMAPEQTHDAHDVDIRADIYSLGCTLFYLLTGQSPFGGGSVSQRLFAHRELPVPDVRKLRAEVPEALTAIIARMMAKKPEDRFLTPKEAAETLRTFRADGAKAPSPDLAKTSAPAKTKLMRKPAASLTMLAGPGEEVNPPVPIPAVPSSEPALQPSAGGNRWRLARVGAVVGALVVLVLVVLMWLGSDGKNDDVASGPTLHIPPASPPSSDRVDIVGETGKPPPSVDPIATKKPVESPKLDLSLGVSTDTLEIGDWLELKLDVKRTNCKGPVKARIVVGDHDKAPTWLQVVNDEIPADGGHGFLALRVKPARDDWEARPLGGQSIHNLQVVAECGTVQVTALLDVKLVPRKKVTGLMSNLLLAPDGKSLYCGAEQGIYVWSMIGKRNKWMTQAIHPAGLAMSANGERLATATNTPVGYTIHLWTGPRTGHSGDIVFEWSKGHQARITSVAMFTDGKRFVSASEDGNIVVCELRQYFDYDDFSKSIRYPWRIPCEETVSHVALSWDDMQLFAAFAKGSIQVWDVATRKVISTLNGHEGALVSMAACLDGSHLVSTGKDGTIRIWDLKEAKQIRKVMAHEDGVEGAALSRDGKRLVTTGADGLIRIWDLTTGEVLNASRFQVHKNLQGHVPLAFSWDGKQVFISRGIPLVQGKTEATFQDAFRVWDLETNEFAEEPSVYWQKGDAKDLDKLPARFCGTLFRNGPAWRDWLLCEAAQVSSPETLATRIRSFLSPTWKLNILLENDRWPFGVYKITEEALGAIQLPPFEFCAYMLSAGPTLYVWLTSWFPPFPISPLLHNRLLFPTSPYLIR